jgi:hypothetical protein
MPDLRDFFGWSFCPGPLRHSTCVALMYCAGMRPASSSGPATGQVTPLTVVPWFGYGQGHRQGVGQARARPQLTIRLCDLSVTKAVEL